MGIPAVHQLRNHLAALDGSSSGTRAALSDLDEAAVIANPTANFFSSVLHVAPFVPSAASIAEESTSGGAVLDMWGPETALWEDLISNSDEDGIQEIAHDAAERSSIARHVAQQQLQQEFPFGMDPVPDLAKATTIANPKLMNM